MDSPLKIGYFGDGRWARRALDRIVDAPEFRVLFVVGRSASPDPKLRAYADDLGVPFGTTADVNRPEFVDTIREYGADVHVSMSFDQILGRELIEMAPEGFINCHAGALPFYRGRNVLNWALINGEDRFGVTVHYIDEGIDTGDILEQRFADITASDDYHSLLEKAVALCADALPDALQQIHAGTADPTPQEDIHPVGFYCSRRGDGDEWLDWSWSTQRVHNFVRALTPPAPGARTRVHGEPLAILDTARIDGAPAYIDRPGTVVGRSGTGVVVKTGDTTIRVRQVAEVGPEGTLSTPRVPDVSIGTEFGVDPWHELRRLQSRVRALEQQLKERSPA